jgi:hypothetical protein
MDVKRSQSVPSDALSIECHELDKRMAEVLALREAVASLETSRQRGEHKGHLYDECGPRSVL